MLYISKKILYNKNKIKRVEINAKSVRSEGRKWRAEIWSKGAGIFRKRETKVWQIEGSECQSQSQTFLIFLCSPNVLLKKTGWGLLALEIESISQQSSFDYTFYVYHVLIRLRKVKMCISLYNIFIKIKKKVINFLTLLFIFFIKFV